MRGDSTTRGKRRRKYLKAVGAGVAVGLAGCTGSRSRQNNLKKLGFTSYVRGGSWITAYVEAARFYCQDNNINLDVRPNRQSASKQITDIRDFANKGYDGIIVGVWSTGAAKSAIDYAMRKGVPVMATNADTASSKIPLYVGFSNYAGGRKSGEQMVKALKQEKSGKNEWHVLNIRGAQGNQSANQRSQGFIDVMKKQDKVVIDRTINGDYAQDTAQNKVQQYINANGKPDGIYSGNLSMGLGVVGALRNLNALYKKGNDKHIVLTQMDGSPQVNPLVKKGFIDAAVDQPNYFYNPIAIKYMGEYVSAGGVDGDGQSAIPNVGSTVKEGGFNINAHQHKGVNLWSKQIWSPAPIKEQNGHPWFQTNSIVITQQNAGKPYLWGNIWSNK
ncbi:sugar ABC transporter substrate-binding protein (plasmid) [Haladaptatus sp. SPP-AMP-3]|uniref:sugar ABC transporter substrate-binding protein n=1 Tax=Haladaptatus sp. SPP-AMP-3 TaxID=3121295 RepID=UPI003C2E02CA